jgi:hypothetical protein
MSSAELVKFLDIVSVVGSAAMAVRLFQTGLYRRYPIFFSYFVFRVPQGIWPLVVNIRSVSYLKLWVLTEPVSWAFYILMVFELSRLVLREYKGLYTVFRAAMIGSVLLSVTLAGLSLVPRINPRVAQTMTGKSIFVRCFQPFLTTERWLDLSLGVFILLILFVLSRYPIVLSRNVRIHSVVYAIYFLANTLAFLLKRFLGVQLQTEVNILLMLVSTGAMAAWLLLLSPAGEAIKATPKKVDAEHERLLLTQLDSLNTTLLRVSKR